MVLHDLGGLLCCANASRSCTALQASTCSHQDKHSIGQQACCYACRSRWRNLIEEAVPATAGVGAGSHAVWELAGHMLHLVAGEGPDVRCDAEGARPWVWAARAVPYLLDDLTCVQLLGAKCA